jgi:hypothetical protein
MEDSLPCDGVLPNDISAIKTLNIQNTIMPLSEDGRKWLGVTNY